jgi:hypothetical protein
VSVQSFFETQLTLKIKPVWAQQHQQVAGSYLDGTSKKIICCQWVRTTTSLLKRMMVPLLWIKLSITI